jgi:hypothetical protein
MTDDTEALKRWLADKAELALEDEEYGELGAKNLTQLYERYLRSDPFTQLRIKEQLQLLLRRTGKIER